MPNYANGKVYMIESLSSGLVYYGSTTQPLYKRLSLHKSSMKTRNCSSKQVLIYDDAKIVLIELVECKSKEELLAKEAHYIRNNECVNKRIEGRTQQEYIKTYRDANKDSIKVKNKIYYDANVEKIKAHLVIVKDKTKARLGAKVVCGCGVEYTHGHASRHLKSKKHINFTLTQQ